MPSSTREIKRKIKSVNSTMQITKAFELVSTAKLRRARIKLDASKYYFETIKNVVDEVIAQDRGTNSRFLLPSEHQKKLVIVVASDRGLCGGYNVNVIKKALEVGAGEETQYIAVGRKSYDYLRSRQYPIAESILYVSEKPTVEDSRYIARKAVQMFAAGEVDSVSLVYTSFVSTISQTPVVVPLLPLQHERSEAEEVRKSKRLTDYLPSQEQVLEQVIPHYVESLVFGAMIESAASEQAARRVAMESATENAEEIIEELTLTFNQARQAAITQEISEIVGGAEALK